MAKNVQFKVSNQAQLEKDIQKNEVTFGNPAYSKNAGDEFKVILSGIVEVRTFTNEETKVTTHPAYALTKKPQGFAVRIPAGTTADQLKEGKERDVIIMENEINGRMVKYASFID